MKNLTAALTAAVLLAALTVAPAGACACEGEDPYAWKFPAAVVTAVIAAAGIGYGGWLSYRALRRPR